MTYYHGSLRVKKMQPKHEELLKQGYTWAKGCGRFRKFICTCSKCRKVVAPTSCNATGV